MHVPFCVRKCAYCDFVSYPLAGAGGERGADRYLEALAREAGWYAARLAPVPLATLYVGGGTPSLLSAAQLERLFTHLRTAFGPWPTGAEVTVEVNPGTVTADKLAALRRAGVNRLSLGAQSFSAALLAAVGRIHGPEEIARTVALARAAGFANLSLDLMFGLPGESLAQLEEDLHRALALGPEHLSVYGLILEEGTPLWARAAAGAVELPDDDLQAEMFELADEVLSEAGYLHYEVSNYARPGREARHNLAYWRNADYLGLGPAASGHAGLLRYQNASGFDEYARRLSGALCEGEPGQAGEEGFPLSPAVATVERLTVEEARSETAFLALRMLREGLDRESFRRRFAADPTELWPAEVARLSAEGLLAVEPAVIRLTRRGVPLANRVFSAFV